MLKNNAGQVIIPKGTGLGTHVELSLFETKEIADIFSKNEASFLPKNIIQIHVGTRINNKSVGFIAIDGEDYQATTFRITEEVIIDMVAEEAALKENNPGANLFGVNEKITDNNWTIV